MSIQLEEILLTGRTINALHRNGMFTVEDVVQYHKAYGIATAKGVGQNSINEINHAILIPYGVGIPLKERKTKKEKKPTKKHLGRNVSQLVRFKQYFDELYGQGLDVAGWHQNGELEPFDNFYESAVDFAKTNKKENNYERTIHR